MTTLVGLGEESVAETGWNPSIDFQYAQGASAPDLLGRIRINSGRGAEFPHEEPIGDPPVGHVTLLCPKIGLQVSYSLFAGGINAS